MFCSLLVILFVSCFLFFNCYRGHIHTFRAPGSCAYTYVGAIVSMSYGWPFLLSSSVPAEKAEESRGSAPRPPLIAAASTHANGNEEDDASSSSNNREDDDYGAEEIFYDQLSGMPAWGNEQQGNKHTVVGAKDATDKTTAAHSRPNAASIEGVERPQKTHEEESSPHSPPKGTASRATVRELAGVVNTAVATMDHAVSIPSALRGAARRTMFDVLVDVQRRNQKKKADSEKQGGTGTKEKGSDSASVGASAGTTPNATVTAIVGGAAAYSSKPTPAAPSARDLTYRVLFPSAAVAAGKTGPVEPSSASSLSHAPPTLASPLAAPQDGNASDGRTEHDTLVPPSTTSLWPRGGNGSHTAPATTAAAASQKAHTVEPQADSAPASSSTCNAAAVTRHTSVTAQRVQSASFLSSSSSSHAAATGGPDRRLRHLLPAHLHGPRLTQKEGKGSPVEKPDGRGRQQCRTAAEEAFGRSGDDDDDTLSDIPSVASDDAHCPRGQCSSDTTAQRPAPEKDACLLEVLEGGYENRNQSKVPSSTLAAEHEKRTAAAATNWLQRLDKVEKESRTVALQQQQQPQRAGTNRSGEPHAVDQRVLEDVLMGQPVHCPSSQEKKREGYRHCPCRKTRSQRGNSHSNERSTADEGSLTGASRASSSSGRDSSMSRSSSAQSKPSTMLDLMRDIDDDVPQWVRQHEARQQLVQQCQQQQPYGLAPFATSTDTASLERERAAAIEPFIGKPATFSPSCAASRRQPQNNAAASAAATIDAASYYRFSSSNTAHLTTDSFFATAAGAAASSFLATWKEGRRLLKQNATAMSVVQYLCTCFDRWKPFGSQLKAQTTSANEEGDNAQEKEGEIDEATHATTIGAQVHDRRDDSSSMSCGGGSDVDAAEKDSGVELKIRVEYIDAAFNVAVVHGALVWCSEDARRRLSIPSAVVPVTNEEVVEENKEEARRNGVARPPQATPLPSSASAEAEDRSWSFLFPEAALMQVNVTVGEHLYVASPYYVYADTHSVLATYNFTSDAVVQKQARQFELELEERLLAIAQVSAKKRTAELNKDTARALWHRALSPVRMSGVGRASQLERSPTDFSKPSDANAPTTKAADRSPNRMVYEIPGYSRTPQRVAQNRSHSVSDASTPLPVLPSANAAPHTPKCSRETHAAVVLEDTVSPEPHPPFPPPKPQQHSDDVGKGNTPLTSDVERVGPLPRDAITIKTASTLPSCVRASTTSVNSLAADDFYDPLAMPAFRPTAATATGEAVTMAADVERDDDRHHCRASSPYYKTEIFPSDEPVAASQYCGDAMDQQPSGSMKATATAAPPAKQTSSDGCLHPPPPFRRLPAALPGGVPNDNHKKRASQLDRADVGDAAGTTATAAARTFGSAVVVEDGVGHGFPRGPLADWDIPVEVLCALSGTTSQRTSRALQKNESDVAFLGLSRNSEDAEHVKQRKRNRRDASSSAERQRGSFTVEVSSPSASIPTQASVVQTGRLNGADRQNGVLPDVSCSFPTPLPSEVEQPSSQAMPAIGQTGNSQSCSSISSPSDHSDNELRSSAPASHRARAETTIGSALSQSKGATRHAGPARYTSPAAAAAETTATVPAVPTTSDTVRVLSDPFLSFSQREWHCAGDNAFAFGSAAASFPVRSTAMTEERWGAHATSTLSSQGRPTTAGRGMETHGSALRPHEAVEEESSMTASTGFYALHDVILSDLDE